MTALKPNKRLRRSARVIVLDPLKRALMFRFDVPDRPPFWVTAGGECETGESFEDAARRELMEETGIDADTGQQVARTTPEFITVEGEPVQADERYFIVHADSAEIDTAGQTELEQKVMTQHRWFTLDELANWHEAVFPETLGKIIETAATD
ncbi:NUDIX hydrolase [Erythrobacter crassostreae]|uniref:NUDIX domain-containing protein n=1 Tax=Erythrobacter crassostreae TaxID=2828328 RepID=A0A9X1F645_9SPHN|nr:NUDIX domain-containing protein [Erythrobacter crassostrea]MBV7259520.1 NUDIX domain-containing protein [Erythrobacter crassostrea]